MIMNVGTSAIREAQRAVGALLNPAAPNGKPPFLTRNPETQKRRSIIASREGQKDLSDMGYGGYGHKLFESLR